MTETELSQIIIGDSPAIRRLRKEILRLAPRNNCVLIQGPTGTGKELVAQALHAGSGRGGLLVKINVCAISPGMFESTLFGHVRGAFTGAISDRRGLLAEASGGTLFLDEIGSLELEQQAKLLRAVEDGVFRPVGATRDHQSSFRLISATNEDLDQLVEAGRFRADLRYRLHGTPLILPALSERGEDLRKLIGHFIRELDHPLRFTQEAIGLLMRYPWPGNVRELRQVIENAAALADHEMVTAADLRRHLRRRGRAYADDAIEPQRRELLELLGSCGWDTAIVAERLGVHRATIYRRLQRFGIPLQNTPTATI